MAWSEEDILEFMGKEIEYDDQIRQIVIKFPDSLVEQLEDIFFELEDTPSATFNLSKYIRIAVIYFIEKYNDVEREFDE